MTPIWPVDMVEKLKTYDKKSDLARITGSISIINTHCNRIFRI